MYANVKSIYNLVSVFYKMHYHDYVCNMYYSLLLLTNYYK